ncbi:MAG: DUF72 domain-containing protein [Flavobacterium sp.]|nr:MAG: DUF72 domain-containing protein [Flavobacterium sp.]
METTTIETGCSSFNEFHWKGIFYPDDLPRSRWFAHYCKYFRTYEMNSSFYKFPTDRTLAAWYAKSPDDFSFAVKMYKGVTHYKKFKDCERLISEFYAVCRDNLKEKLSTVLFQLPPSYSFTPERLALVIASVDPSFTNAVEFRHKSWWQNEVYDALVANNIIFCSVSYPELPEDIVATTNVAYVRLHGSERLFYSGYAGDYLSELERRISGTGCEKAYVYFNNTASAEGIKNALDFERIVSANKIS